MFKIKFNNTQFFFLSRSKSIQELNYRYLSDPNNKIQTRHHQCKYHRNYSQKEKRLQEIIKLTKKH